MENRKFIGRKNIFYEIKTLLESEQSEMIAMIGKRRIGKTRLSKEIISELGENEKDGIKYITLYFTGQHGVDKKETAKYLNRELNNFILENNYLKIFNDIDSPLSSYNKKSKDFFGFFSNLKSFFQKLKNVYGEKFKFIVFFDEVSWIEGKRITKNGFKSALSLYWNDSFAHEKQVKFFLTGSASHWIIENFINDKGGLHGRTTHLIKLKPFDLKENYEYLKTNINPYISKKESILYYMAFGGTAYYLSLCKPNYSFEENIKYLFNNEILKNEYHNLFKSIFPLETHKKIITILAEQKSIGRSIKFLVDKIKKSETEIRESLNDLLITGFIKERKYFNETGKEKFYYLNDLFCYFHNSFLEKKSLNFSIHDLDFKIWSGFAFELVVFNQIDLIKKAKGFLDVDTEEYCFLNKQKDNIKNGFQIDLIIERADKKIHLIETKFRDNFVYDKKESEELYKKFNGFMDENEKNLKNKKVEMLLVGIEDMKINYIDSLINDKKIINLTEEF